MGRFGVAGGCVVVGEGGGVGAGVVRHGCGDDLQFYCFQCSRFSISTLLSFDGI